MSATRKLPRAVIFDFDGTLVDSARIKFETFFVVTNDIVDASDLLSELLKPEHNFDRYKIFRRVAQSFFPRAESAERAEQLAANYSKICRGLIIDAQEIRGATELLQNLSQLGVDLFVSSATPQVALHDLVDDRQWRLFFQGAFGGPSTKDDHLEMIKRMLGCESDEMLTIGDSIADLAIAENMGCRFAGIGQQFLNPAHRRHYHQDLSNLQDKLLNFLD